MTNQAATPIKPDNLFGVCHEIGAIFGFNPLYLRLAFMIGMLANFEIAAIAYGGLALVLLATALIARFGVNHRTVPA